MGALPPALPATHGTRPRQWISGLDGLRAIAVIAVVVFHLNPDYLPGGFAGVDIFFVISGYLITRLLLDERARTGAIALEAFYIRRARRLLPAVMTLIAIVFVAGTLIWRDQRPTITGSSLASLGYVTNWWLIGGEQSYFVVSGRPPMLQHLWSLAIEEQYYVLWAPIVIILTAWGALRWSARHDAHAGSGRRGMTSPGALLVLVVAAAAALLSTALMAWVAVRDGVPFQADSGRVYFGTDTHSMGLFVGSAVGAATHLRLTRSRLLGTQPRSTQLLGSRPLRSRLGRIPLPITDIAALMLLLSLITGMAVFNEFEPALYRGGFLLLSLVTVAVIAGAARNGSQLGRWLDIPLLRWIGQRSYGIYLWHWPVAVVTRPGIDLHGPTWLIDSARVAITVLLAAASYRWVEQRWRSRAPVTDRQQSSFRRTWATAPTSRRIAVPAIAALCGVVLISGQMAAAQQKAAPAVQPGTNVTAQAEPVSAEVAVLEPTLQPLLTPPTAATTSSPAPTTRASQMSRTLPPRGTSYFNSLRQSLPVADAATGLPPATQSSQPSQSSQSSTAGESSAVPPNPEPASSVAARAPALPESIPAAPTATNPAEPAPATSPSAKPADPKLASNKPASSKPVKKAAAKIKTTISAFGDSVMLGAKGALKKACTKISLTADVGTQPWTLLDQVTARHKSGKLAKTVVIQAGNNGVISPQQLTGVLTKLKDRKQVVLVNIHVDRAWEKPNNKTLATAAKKFKNVTLVDWKSAASDNPTWLAPDGMHLAAAGAKAYTKLITAALR